MLPSPARYSVSVHSHPCHTANHTHNKNRQKRSAYKQTRSLELQANEPIHASGLSGTSYAQEFEAGLFELHFEKRYLFMPPILCDRPVALQRKQLRNSC